MTRPSATIGDTPVLGLPGSVVLDLAAAAGRRAVGEGFPDRGYDGTRLRPRDQPGALVHEPADVAANAVRLARDPSLATVCVHGDSPSAVATAHAVRQALVEAGWDVRPWLDPA